MGKRGPKTGTRQWVQGGAVHVWRQPYVEDGKWRCRLRRKADGREFYRTLEAPVLKSKGRGIAKAMEEVAALAAKEGPGAPPPPDAREKGRTVKDALLAWLEEQKPYVSTATFLDYSGEVERIMNAIGPEVGILDVTKEMLREKFRTRWGHLGGRSQAKAAFMIKAIFADLADQDVIPSSPAVVLKKRRRWGQEIKAAREETHQALTIEEARRLVAASREPTILKYRGGSVSDPIEADIWSFLWLMISLRVGLRKSDTLGERKYGKAGLRWRSVDLEEGRIEIPWHEYKGRRTLRVPLCNEVWKILNEYRASLPKNLDPETRVIPGIVQDARKTLRILLRRAKLVDAQDNFIGELANKLSPRPFTIHSLRNSYAGWLSTGGKQEKRLLLGHAPVDVTDKYGRTMESVLRKATNRIPNIASGVRIQAQAQA